ncbi:MAG TPA: DMT family transporter [Pseudobdellovibrionaceae bacterium]|jgi:drug/metabolite transporter (DMT)-like permease
MFKELKMIHQIMPALFAATLFGASTPLAKVLIGEMDSWILAGILYFGSGIGLLAISAVQSLKAKSLPVFPNKKDFFWLMGATFFGGILGPVFLMKGLSLTTASTSSLLLNMEGVLTSCIAWIVFKEHYDRRIVLGMMAIIMGGMILSWSSAGEFSLSSGSFFILGACLCWGIDNNLTRMVSANDAVLITTLKSVVAGSTNLILALSLGRSLPAAGPLAWGALLGFLGYGLSIVCFVLSLRAIGTSRTGAYFSAAPFVGATLSLFLFKNELSLQFILAAGFMGWGLWLHVTEIHNHEHEHEPLYHSHEHTHDDEHHQHEHLPAESFGKKHTHYHQHEKMRHQHSHFPDIHHRH